MTTVSSRASSVVGPEGAQRLQPRVDVVVGWSCEPASSGSPQTVAEARAVGPAERRDRLGERDRLATAARGRARGGRSAASASGSSSMGTGAPVARSSEGRDSSSIRELERHRAAAGSGCTSSARAVVRGRVGRGCRGWCATGGRGPTIGAARSRPSGSSSGRRPRRTARVVPGRRQQPRDVPDQRPVRAGARSCPDAAARRPPPRRPIGLELVGVVADAGERRRAARRASRCPS